MFRRPLQLPVLASLTLLLASCVSPPKPPTVTEPRWFTLTGRSKARIADHLAAADAAWSVLQARSASTAHKQQAEQEYEAAVAAVLKQWNQRQLPRRWHSGTVFQSPAAGAYTVSFAESTPDASAISPRSLDRIVLAEEVRTARGSQAAVEAGLGVPVVGQKLRSENGAADADFMPLNGAQITLTALMEFSPPLASGQPRRCRLVLHNPLQKDQARIAGSRTQLAANYTAAKELALNDGFLKGFSLVGLFFPQKTLADSRLYTLDPYDPKRIPVVFVHGLMSDPHIWYNAINALYADPALRARYQPWYFLYPTGLAVPATAQRLRQSLRETCAHLDPEGDDPGLRRMVLVGHSMGGLLSRMQVIDPGDSMWRAYFTRPPEELNVSASTRKRLVDALHFQPNPDIRRLVFIAVPHRGSELAGRNIVVRLSSLIRLPFDTLLLAKEILTGSTDAISPQVRDWGKFAILSVGTLSPRHPYLQALNAHPIPVPHHSIIGRTGSLPLEESSDRIVPYRSAHLDTGTEIVVPYWHGCVEKPEVIAEVLQRLRQHLRE